MIVLRKAYGATPLQAIDALRARDPRYATAKLGYAGRLDPLAEGVLLVLEGDENRDPGPWRALDKRYDLDVLFGFATDSHDLLGLASEHRDATVDRDAVEHAAVERPAVESVLGRFRGTIEQRVPSFSSAKVQGRRLYAWARDGRTDLAEPRRTRTVWTLVHRGGSSIARAELSAWIARAVGSVRGEFRQDAIAARWAEVLASTTRETWNVMHLSVHCSSGTYMRALARDLGEACATPALALRIVRTAVGPHTLDEAR